MSNRRLALLGGPGSGKSTYLGALVDGIGQGATRLELDSLPRDARALDQLTEPLLDGRYPERTPSETRTPLELPVRATIDGQQEKFILQTGDLAGEAVNRVFQDRLWSDEWDRWATADALLLFVRPSGYVPFPRFHVDEDEWQSLREPLASPAGARAPSPEDIFGPGFTEEAPRTPQLRRGEPQRIPTSLAMVDLLQLVRQRRGLAPGVRKSKSAALRVAIVVSAWDARPGEWRDKTPGDWLASEMALLEDFLWSNFDESDVLRFGLSTTGGDLLDPRHQKTYLDNPSGYVVWNHLGQPTKSNDLSLPVLWAIFGRAALPDPS